MMIVIMANESLIHSYLESDWFLREHIMPLVQWIEELRHRGGDQAFLV